MRGNAGVLRARGEGGRTRSRGAIGLAKRGPSATRGYSFTPGVRLPKRVRPLHAPHIRLARGNESCQSAGERGAKARTVRSVTPQRQRARPLPGAGLTRLRARRQKGWVRRRDCERAGKGWVRNRVSAAARVPQGHGVDASVCGDAPVRPGLDAKSPTRVLVRYPDPS